MTSKYNNKVNAEIRRRVMNTLPSLLTFSLAINLLVLTGPLFMLQIYDRVIPSRSIPTLIGLFMLVGILFAFLSAFELLRTKLLSRLAYFIDSKFSESYQRLAQQNRNGVFPHPGNELSVLTGYLKSSGPGALLDTIFVPFYFLLLYALHPLLAAISLIGTMIVCLSSLFGSFLSRNSSKAGGDCWRVEKTYSDHLSRKTPQTKSIRSTLVRHWLSSHRKTLVQMQNAFSAVEITGSISKGLRMFIQSGMLAAGAYLVIEGQLSAGAMIAASIIAGRLLFPIDQSVSNWQTLTAAKKAWNSIRTHYGEPGDAKDFILPRPAGALSLISVTTLDKRQLAEGIAKPLLHNIDFEIDAGDGLSITGPGGSGKSNLIELIAGVNDSDRGNIRLDGAKYCHWSASDLGKYIGYLPQNASVFQGTIAQNISGFSTDENISKIIETAKLCCLHSQILKLPGGYEYVVDAEDPCLSSSIIQKIGIARAIFTDPVLVLLDEPTAHLDAQDERMLSDCIHHLRRQGTTVIVTSHRPLLSTLLNKVLVLNEGKQVTFANRDEIFEQSNVALLNKGLNQ